MSQATIQTMDDAASVIEQRRRALGLTQAQLAQRAGVSRRLVNALEHGHPRAESALLLRVLTALGIALEGKFTAQADIATRIERIQDANTSLGLPADRFALELRITPEHLDEILGGTATQIADATMLHARRLRKQQLTGGRGWFTAAEEAGIVQGILDEGNENYAFRRLLQARDQLRDRTTNERATWASEAPHLTDPRWQTLFAAITDTEYQAHGWPDSPHWAKPTVLPHPWTPIPNPNDEPAPYRHLNITTSTRDFETY